MALNYNDWNWHCEICISFVPTFWNNYYHGCFQSFNAVAAWLPLPVLKCNFRQPVAKRKRGVIAANRWHQDISRAWNWNCQSCSHLRPARHTHDRSPLINWNLFNVAPRQSILPATDSYKLAPSPPAAYIIIRLGPNLQVPLSPKLWTSTPKFNYTTEGRDRIHSLRLTIVSSEKRQENRKMCTYLEVGRRRELIQSCAYLRRNSSAYFIRRSEIVCEFESVYKYFWSGSVVFRGGLGWARSISTYPLARQTGTTSRYLYLHSYNGNIPSRKFTYLPATTLLGKSGEIYCGKLAKSS